MKQKAPLQQPPQSKSEQTHSTRNSESLGNEPAYSDAAYNEPIYKESAYNDQTDNKPIYSEPSIMGRSPEEMVQMMGADAFVQMTTAPDVYAGWMKERGLDKDPVYRKRHEMRMKMLYPSRYTDEKEELDKKEGSGEEDEQIHAKSDQNDQNINIPVQRESDDEEVNAEEEEREENADLQRAGGTDGADEDDIQEASLRVSSPTDQSEIEAENVSNRVMTMADPTAIHQKNTKTLTRKSEVEESDENDSDESKAVQTIQRDTSDDTDDENDVALSGNILARKTEGGSSRVNPGITSRINQQRGSGTSLPETTQSFMGNRMNADFSGVLIHNNSESFDLSKSLNAKAFTVGNDVFFGQGQYAPETHSGKKLIAHELTHTLQNGSVQRNILHRRSNPYWNQDSGEREQEEHADQGKEEKAGGIRGKIDSMMRHIPGYSLVWLMLGKNFVTGLRVKRTPKNYVRAFLGVIPGGEFIYQQLNQAGAIDEALAYLNLQMKKYNVDPKVVKKQLSDWWSNVSLWKVWKYGEYGNQLKSIIATPIRLLLMFGRFLWDKAKEMIFRGFLKMIGAPVKTVMGVLKRAGSALKKIFEDPKTFFKNLGSAIKTGFNKFTSNIWTYLKQGLFGWLLGTFASTGLSFPKKFNLFGIFQLLAQIFGLTYQAIRARIVKGLGSMGEKIMGFLEKSFDFIKKLVVNGPLALWGVIKEKIGNIKQMFFGGIIGWLRNTIIVKALTRIALMLNPVGAIIGIVKAIYDIIMFFVNNWKRIVDLVSTIFNSLNEIAFGRIGKAAGFILGSLIKAVPIVISFLARLLNISGIVNKVKQIIGKIKKPVDKAVGKVVGWVVKKGKALWARIKGVAGKIAGKVKAWWKSKVQFKTKRGETHTIFFKGSGANARLMIASYTQFFENFLATAKIPEGANKNKAIMLKNKLLKLSNDNLKPIYVKLRKKGLSERDRKKTISELRAILRKMKVKTKNFYDLIIDPNDPVIPKAKNEFQSVVTQRNNELKQNVGNIEKYAKEYRLSDSQRKKASEEYWFTRVMYGVILEKMVAESLALNKFQYKAGAGQPDFIGRGEYTNLFFDVTTNKSEVTHKRRVYGDRLIMGLYTGPSKLGLFPYTKNEL